MVVCPIFTAVKGKKRHEVNGTNYHFEDKAIGFNGRFQKLTTLQRVIVIDALVIVAEAKVKLGEVDEVKQEKVRQNSIQVAI